MSKKDGKKQKELSPKHKLFAIEYLKDFNATRAYQEVYEVSYKIAHASGSRLLANVSGLQGYIDSLIDQTLKAGRKVLEKRFVNEIQVIGFSRLSDYLDDSGKIDFGKLSKINPGAVKEFKETTFEGENNSRTVKEFKLHGKDKSLELIGKYLGILTEKVEHSGDINLIFGEDEAGI